MVDISQLDAEEKQRLLLRLREIADLKAKNALTNYKPYDWQEKFHRATVTATQICLMAPNRCVSPWTWVETETGPARAAEVFFSGSGRVRAWSGTTECIAPVVAGFRKGIKPAFRLVMDTGQWIDCTARHRVLTERGWLSVARLALLASGRCSRRTPEDYWASCVEDGYLCDPPLPSEAGGGQAPLPSPAGARTRPRWFWRKGAEARKSGRSRASLLSGRLSSSDAWTRLSPVARWSALAASRPVLCPWSRTPEAPPSPAQSSLHREVSVLRRGECVLSNLGPSVFLVDDHPALVGGRKIVAIVPIGSVPIVDCHVLGVNNYFAGGVINHNCGKTLAAAMQVAMWATGIYPSWYLGRKFPLPTRGWVCSVDYPTLRQAAQKLLLGPDNDGTGSIPADRILKIDSTRGAAGTVDTVRIRHSSGGESVIIFKAYSQGRQAFQGDNLDWCWMDEEPRPTESDLWGEIVARLLVSKGPLILTYTPIFGRTEITRKFLDGEAGRELIHIGAESVPHLAGEIAKMRREYPPHEWDARIHGLPSKGEGAVFPVDERRYVRPRQEMPSYAQYIVGLDIGIDHPTAMAVLAYLPDTDMVYVLSEYRRPDKIKDANTPREVFTPAFHAQFVRSFNPDLPVAWPHDADNREKGSGVTAKVFYKQAGLNMLPEHAQYNDDRGNGLESSIGEMYERLCNADRGVGGLVIFDTCTMLLDEMRGYHRKNHKPVPREDDLISAVRYGLMMLRYSRPMSRLAQRKHGAPASPLLPPPWWQPAAPKTEKAGHWPVVWSSDWSKKP